MFLCASQTLPRTGGAVDQDGGVSRLIAHRRDVVRVIKLGASDPDPVFGHGVLPF